MLPARCQKYLVKSCEKEYEIMLFLLWTIYRLRRRKMDTSSAPKRTYFFFESFFFEKKSQIFVFYFLYLLIHKKSFSCWTCCLSQQNTKKKHAKRIFSWRKSCSVCLALWSFGTRIWILKNFFINILKQTFILKIFKRFIQTDIIVCY